jgi:uncharacterized phage protein (TIGR02218 family)
MTRTIGANLKNHLAENVTTLSYLWKITRTDTTEFHFTDCDKDIVYGGDTYKSLNSGTLSSIDQKADLSPDNFDFEIILSSAEITKADVVAGLYDFADVKVYLINRESVGDGVVNLINGKLGEAKIQDDHKATIEFRSLTQLLEQAIGRVYSHECDADLGDTRCGVTLGSYTNTGTITSVTNNQEFAASALGQSNDYFNYGMLSWTSGNNNNIQMEVKAYTASGGLFTLVSPMPFSVATGDTFSVSRGCDKQKLTCKNDFSNILNFRGFAEIPGMDLIKRTPDVNPDAGLHD